MFASARSISRLIIWALFLASGVVVLAQTSINDVHIVPRQRGVQLIVPSAAAGLPTASLIHASVELVMVPVTITDAMNRPVVGLDRDNFQVYENKKPQEIKHFSSEDTPIAVGIIVDTSGSMSYKLDRAREAVAQFCDTANPQDEFFMITFADTPRLVTDFTTRSEQVQNDLLTVRSKGRTSLLDAIYMAVRKMRSARYSRRALLILSDGGDNHSRYTEHDVKGAIKESDLLIYAVGTYDKYVNTEEELLGPELLRSIAEVTGGQAYTLPNINEMPAVTRSIGIQLRHQYMLAYQPLSKPKDGKWHKISVKLRLPKSFHQFLRVDARTGYYANEE